MSKWHANMRIFHVKAFKSSCQPNTLRSLIHDASHYAGLCIDCLTLLFGTLSFDYNVFEIFCNTVFHSFQYLHISSAQNTLDRSAMTENGRIYWTGEWSLCMNSWQIAKRKVIISKVLFIFFSILLWPSYCRTWLAWSLAGKIRLVEQILFFCCTHNPIRCVCSWIVSMNRHGCH